MTAAGDQHQRISELLGAFVLHAVEADEATLVELHLESCPRCRGEVDQLREVAAAIGSTAEPPPEALWDRIAGNLEAPGSQPVAPDPSVDRSGQPGASPTPEGGGSPRSVAVLPPPDARPWTTPSPGGRHLAGRGSRRRRAWTAAGVFAAAACAALAAVFGVNWSNASSRVGQLQDALARQGAGSAVEAALTSPGHQTFELRGQTGVRVAEVVVRSDGAGYVVSSQMQGLPGTETYQLWAEIAGRPISLGLLGAKPERGDAFSLGSSRTAASKLMVTVEPSGGVVSPTSAPVASAALS